MIEGRNIYAHETEQAFAKPLMKDEHRGLCYLWEPYFLFCFKKSVEILAGEKRDRIDFIYDGL